MALAFRTALLSERDELERVWRAAFTPFVRALGRDLPAHGSAEFAAGLARVEAELQRGDVYVALDADHIVGLVRTERQKDELYIDQIAVDPVRQRSGVGSWLLQRVEEVARSASARGLLLETPEMMEHLIRLYRRHGFEIVRRGPPAHGMDAHIRVFMEKTFT
jgi:ribosomal protein S18 acetylase RimI-like enzyme